MSGVSWDAGDSVGDHLMALDVSLTTVILSLYKPNVSIDLLWAWYDLRPDLWHFLLPPTAFSQFRHGQVSIFVFLGHSSSRAGAEGDPVFLSLIPPVFALPVPVSKTMS